MAMARAGASFRASRSAILLGFAIFVYVFVQNAWVAEDAYITFRSLEQLFAGNGLRWNPHERVQVYVHPLWFWLLAAFRLFSTDVFANAIAASFVASIAALLVLARSLGTTRWLALLALLISSKSAIDYTSSGLENPLSFLLLALLFVVLRRIGDLRSDAASETPPNLTSRPFQVSLLLSLLLLSRPDLATLVGPAFGWALWRLRGMGLARLWKPILLGLAPLALFLVFSVAYFGFLLPNPAYAKMFTGIAREHLVTQGFAYVATLRLFDPVLPLVAIGAFIRGAASKRPLLRAMAFGLPLNLVYVIWVGGDFMTGRMFASAYLWSAILLAAAPWRRSWTWGPLLALAVSIGLTSSFSPLRSTPSYHYPTVHRQVGDERGTYFPYASLHAWWTRDPGRVFPNYRFSRDGLRASRRAGHVQPSGNVGMFGYWAGTEKIVVDQLGLADPLLARLPSRGLWRIGHFGRPRPKGYAKSLLMDQNLIEDPAIHRLYEDLRLITQGDLFDTERFAAILRRNLALDGAAISKDYESEPMYGKELRPRTQGATRSGAPQEADDTPGG